MESLSNNNFQSGDQTATKKAKHPTICRDCLFFKGYCKLGYKTEASSASCRQGIEKTAKKEVSTQ